ncbi:hypothetical protein LZ31DRAFT_550468 [Colletotrichum somersetense]|nr:hypothetical protein LZ31DRAFT_550468 [Colletotrichum somersetense]
MSRYSRVYSFCFVVYFAPPPPLRFTVLFLHASWLKYLVDFFFSISFSRFYGFHYYHYCNAINDEKNAGFGPGEEGFSRQEEEQGREMQPAGLDRSGEGGRRGREK